MLNELFGFEIGDGHKIEDKIKSRYGVDYVRCNTNPPGKKGKRIYRATMNGNKIKIVLYTYKQWEDTLKGFFSKNPRGDLAWEKVEGLGNEDASGVVKLVNSVEEAKKALQYLYATFDKRLRDEAPKCTKRPAECAKAMKPARTRKRPAKLM